MKKKFRFYFHVAELSVHSLMRLHVGISSNQKKKSLFKSRYLVLQSKVFTKRAEIDHFH